ncbi:MAG: GOLPH3/VPS74 family protein [Actinomycetota bacterium]
MASELTVAEELLLLCWDDERGKRAVGGQFDQLLAGALLIDLTLEGLIEVVDGKVEPAVGASPTGPMRAALLDRIRADAKPRKISRWMQRWAGDKEVRQAPVDRLVDRGVLRVEERRVLRLFHVTRHPLADPARATEVRQRIGGVLTDDRPAAPRDAALAGLVATAGSGAVGRLVERSQRRAALKRGRQLAKEGVVGEVGEAVAQAQAAAMTAVTAAAAASAASSASSSN